jgi:choline kinase
LYEGKIKALSKELSLEQATGESIPLMKFSLNAFQALKIIADRYLARKKFRTLMESVISELIKKESLSVNALNVSGLKWCEIDTPADWEKARRLF